MSLTASIVAAGALYLLVRATAHLPRLAALVIASVTGSVLIRRKRRSDVALIGRQPTSACDRWQRSTRSERRLLRCGLRDTMRLTVHRSLFLDVTSV